MRKSSVEPLTASPDISTRCRETVARPRDDCDPHVHFDGLLAIDQLRQEPARFDTLTMANFEKIDDRITSGRPVP